MGTSLYAAQKTVHGIVQTPSGSVIGDAAPPESAGHAFMSRTVVVVEADDGVGPGRAVHAGSRVGSKGKG